MDLNEFLRLERHQLQQERARLKLNHNNNSNLTTNANECPAALLMQGTDYSPAKCQRKKNAASKCIEPSRVGSALATATPNSVPSTPRSYIVSEVTATAEVDVLDADLHLDLSTMRSEDGRDDDCYFDEDNNSSRKENKRELLLGSARNYKSPNVSPRKLESGRPLSENRLPIRRIGRGDDMEQWVTDTFYSYFPGFNNENQKRQNYLRERQRENQQNFLRHQMLHPPPQKHVAHSKPRLPINDKQLMASKAMTTTKMPTVRSGASTTTTTSSTTDKTDLELIVNNNPNFVPPKTTTSYEQSKMRHGTIRHKLLQDLGHVELSNIVTGDGIMERNMRSAELETARKKDYQRDLMQQIEEKRRSIELLREKERRQEEALTRRLEAQLKTIQLQEQLEQERMRAEKVRSDTEHNRFMREQLLAKLEKDAQTLNTNRLQKESNNLTQPLLPAISSGKNNEDNNNNSNNTSKSNPNKVYQYFSNSARHEYKRGHPLPPAVELDFEVPAMAKIERECFHLCDKICPLCDEPLKSYESCCLRCQRKLALKMKQRQPGKPADSGSIDEQDNETANVEYEDVEADQDDADHFCHTSYALVCLKCERLYALCTTCLAKSDVCRACQRQRNVCMNCRRTLCSFCLEEVACGKDTERMHINERDDEQTRSDDAFRVLDVRYAVPSSQECTATNDDKNANDSELNTSVEVEADLELESSPPFSINIAQNSVFHGDYKPTPVKQSFMDQQLPTASGSANNSFEVDSADEVGMARLRRQTEQRLSRYVKNYGDLALDKKRSKSDSRHRGTQTTPQSTDRRDIVIHEAATQNLSMPLLREMPKMTRNETDSLSYNNPRKMDNLTKRWEVPAVQKFTVSSSSPKVLTQVGAMRKQLQAARFFDDDDGDS